MHRNRATTARGLRLVHDDLAARLHASLPNMYVTPLEVDIAPPKSEYLTATETKRGKMPGADERIVGDNIEESTHLGGAPGLHLRVWP